MQVCASRTSPRVGPPICQPLHCVVNDAGGLTMRHKTASVSTAKPEQGSLELTEELVRIRAYRLYEERGCIRIASQHVGR